MVAVERQSNWTENGQPALEVVGPGAGGAGGNRRAGDGGAHGDGVGPRAEAQDHRIWRLLPSARRCAAGVDCGIGASKRFVTTYVRHWD